MREKFTDREIAFMNEAARENALDWFETVQDRLEAGVREIKRERERFLRACEDQDKYMKAPREEAQPYWRPEESISSTINHVQWLVPNMRLDLGPTYYHALRQAAEIRLSAAEKGNIVDVKSAA